MIISFQNQPAPTRGKKHLFLSANGRVPSWNLRASLSGLVLHRGNGQENFCGPLPHGFAAFSGEPASPVSQMPCGFPWEKGHPFLLVEVKRQFPYPKKGRQQKAPLGNRGFYGAVVKELATHVEKEKKKNKNTALTGHSSP